MNTATPFDDLAITKIMSPVVVVTGSVALCLWVLFVICEIFRLQYEGVKAAVDSGGGNAPQYGPFLLRAFTILTTLSFIYTWTFLKMVSLCDYIFMLFNNEDAWLSLINQLAATDTSASILHSNIPTLLGAAAISVLQVAQDLFFAFRFVVLAVLYVSGPIVWAFGVSEIGVRSIKGWFKHTWQVSFWIVVFGIVKAAVVPLGLYALSNSTTGTLADAATGAAVGLVYAIVILMMMSMIPKLTGALFSDEHISAVSGAIAGAAIAYYSSAHDHVVGGAYKELGRKSGRWAGPLGKTIGSLRKKKGPDGDAKGGPAGAPTPPPPPSSPPEAAGADSKKTR